MEIIKRKTAAFSGHRSFKMNGAQGDLFSRGNATGESAIAVRIRAESRKLIEKGYDTFLCGMAEGFDLMAAEAIVSLRQEFPGIRLIAAIPYPGQADAFNGNTQALYARILNGADDTITISPRYSHDCYHRRNDFLVDNSTALICYFNGSKGGTAYTVRRALKNSLIVINTL